MTAERSNPVTPAELFHRAGVALFGDQYVAPMAVTLSVDKNTVGKWRDGKSKVPLGVWRSIAAELLKRLDAITSVSEALGRHIQSELQQGRPA
jgi:hypothetical protein